jgi:uncharacterized damage-inducible protein DinB
MSSDDLIRRLHQHRMWANRKLLDAAHQLTPEDLRRPIAIGQGSVWKSLLHLYAAEFVWLEALQGDEAPLVQGDLRGKLPGNQEGPGAIASLDELTNLWHELDARWQAYLDRVRDDDLPGIVYKVNTWGVRSATPVGDILLHVCTHAHYTTAQVINMLRQLGFAPLPDPMLITLAREETAGS